MEATVKLYSTHENEINRFLNSFFSHQLHLAKNKKNTNMDDNSKLKSNGSLEWQKKYQNPLEIVDIIGTFIENNDRFQINMWISLDEHIYINVTDSVADKLIRYMYERYPW